MVGRGCSLRRNGQKIGFHPKSFARTEYSMRLTFPFRPYRLAESRKLPKRLTQPRQGHTIALWHVPGEPLSTHAALIRWLGVVKSGWRGEPNQCWVRWSRTPGPTCQRTHSLSVSGVTEYDQFERKTPSLFGVSFSASLVVQYRRTRTAGMGR